MSESSTSTVSTADEAIAAFKAQVIDGAVRASRTNGWCSHFETAMSVIFPEGSGEPDGAWRDSDGFTCRGFDRDGFNVDGWNAEGYNKAGFNYDGYNKAGFNAEGYNAAGYNAEGVNAQGVRFDDPDNPYRYDRNGYDVNGWHHTDDRNRDGYTRADRQGSCVYDRDGYKADGLNRYGERRRTAE